MTESEPLQGYITAFDIAKNTGIVFSSADGKEYPFSAEDMIGKIPELQNYPGVFFFLSEGRAISIKYNPDAVRPKEKARKGLAILGAARCPNCDWRLPILPSAGMPKIRKGEGFKCPECETALKLNSILMGKHHYIAVGILTLGILAFRRIPYWDMKLLVIPVTLLIFVYIHLLEKLVVDEVSQTFE